MNSIELIVVERFGSLPVTPDGKQLAGVEMRPPLRGEVYFHPTFGRWKTITPPHNAYHVAVFEGKREGVA